MVAYRDVDKKCGDVLRVGYCHDKPWSVAVSHGGANPKLSAMTSMSSASLLDATPTLRYCQQGVTVEAKAGSTGAAAVDVKYDFPKSANTQFPILPLFAGLTLAGRMERRMVKSVPSDSTELSAEYKNDIVHGRVHFNPHNSAWGATKCLTTSIHETGSLIAGGSLNGTGKDISSLNYSVGMSFSQNTAKPWTLAVKAAPHPKLPFGNVTGSFYAASEKGHSIAAEATHAIPDSTTKVTLGSMVYLDPKKATWVKTKLMPNAQVASVLCHKFSDNLTGSFGCQFSSAPSGSSEPVTYGIKLALTC